MSTTSANERKEKMMVRDRCALQLGSGKLYMIHEVDQGVSVFRAEDGRGKLIVEVVNPTETFRDWAYATIGRVFKEAGAA